MPAPRILERLKSGECLLLDGGTGSELQRRGVNVLTGVSAESGLQAWSALANIGAADVVQQVHRDYLRVGREFAEHARLVADTQIIGGCCATGPEHIQAMGAVVKG